MTMSRGVAGCGLQVQVDCWVKDGVGEALGAEGGIEADEAGVHAEQKAGRGGGKGEVGGVGSAAAAEKIGQRADGDHAEAEEGERAAKEAHGAAGEVEEVAEGEVVVRRLAASRVAMSVWGSTWGAAIAKKKAMAAQSEPMGTSSQRCQRSALASPFQSEMGSTMRA